MPTATASTLVLAPAEETFDFLADYRNIPRLQPQFASARLMSAVSTGIGAVIELQGRFHGMPMKVRNRIVGFARPRRIASISEGTVNSRTVWELREIPGDEPATFVTLTIDYKMAGRLGGLVAGVASSLFNKEIQSMTDESLIRLRAFLSPEKHAGSRD